VVLSFFEFHWPGRIPGAIGGTWKKTPIQETLSPRGRRLLHPLMMHGGMMLIQCRFFARFLLQISAIRLV
ncbi:hypothetical protein TSAR_010670, partial [Trichomalopsis sarcophagae]